jgi:carbamoyltransferase
VLILGLNAYHADSAACLLRDGAVVAAAEEERFRRIKHWAGFPSEAIRYCLNEAGATLASLRQ